MRELDMSALFARLRAGDTEARNELFQRVYRELHTIARAEMARQRPSHTLQATALVNEAYLQLVGPESGTWQNRAHFFAAAATTIRRILVQHARRVASLKRGGDRKRASLDVSMVESKHTDEQIIAVDEALERLAVIDANKARLVELRFFAGMSTEEMAESLGVSPRTVAREWDLAKAWLSRELSEPQRHGY